MIVFQVVYISCGHIVGAGFYNPKMHVKYMPITHLGVFDHILGSYFAWIEVRARGEHGVRI